VLPTKKKGYMSDMLGSVAFIASVRLAATVNTKLTSSNAKATLSD
jgi:hypothetical protein